jgi:hypothetical protein
MLLMTLGATWQASVCVPVLRAEWGVSRQGGGTVGDIGLSMSDSEGNSELHVNRSIRPAFSRRTLKVAVPSPAPDPRTMLP